MNRSGFPHLEAEARRISDALKPLLNAYREKGLAVTIAVAPFGAGGGIAYLSTGERDSMISALEELVTNLKAERRMGARAPTVVDVLKQLRSSVLHMLHFDPATMSDEEGLARVQALADLVGYTGTPRVPGARA